MYTAPRSRADNDKSELQILSYQSDERSKHNDSEAYYACNVETGLKLFSFFIIYESIVFALFIAECVVIVKLFSAEFTYFHNRSTFSELIFI